MTEQYYCPFHIETILKNDEKIYKDKRGFCSECNEWYWFSEWKLKRVMFWTKPESGYGEFDDYFNWCYDAAEGELMVKHPKKCEDDDFRIGGACDIAEKATTDHIRSLGYKVVE